MKILFIGDSLTTGEGINPYQTWPVMISKTLHEKYPDIFCQILAWPGDTTRICLERMARQPKLYHGDIAVVQFGLNDKNKWVSDEGIARVTPRSFYANFDEIEIRLVLFGAKAIIRRLDCGNAVVTDYFLSDGIHLNKEGHRVWYDDILEELKEVLNERNNSIR